MDIISALAILSPFPVDMHEQYYTYAGAYHPVLIPTAALSVEQHHFLLTHGHSTQIEAPFLIALHIKDYPMAWSLYERIPASHIPSPRMSAQMSIWISQQLSQSATNTAQPSQAHTRNGIIIRSTNAAHRRASKDCVRIYNSLLTSYMSLPRILWVGSILIEDAAVHDRADAKRAVHSSVNARPLLPHIQLATWTEADICRQLSTLMLMRVSPPDDGWPQWIIDGCAQVTLAQYHGTGPSPRAMRRRRVAAGAAQIHALWNNQTVDSKLAMALCAPLLHSKQRQHFASFLDLLRNGADAQSAYRIAYTLSLDDLLSNR